MSKPLCHSFISAVRSLGDPDIAEIPKLLDSAESFHQLQRGATWWLAATGRKAKRALATAGDAYQAEEQWFKQSFFIDQ